MLKAFFSSLPAPHFWLLTMYRLGIDTGGTFTDFVLQTPGGMETWKIPSTPEDPARAIMEGLAHFFDRLPDGLEIVHGSTVGTNAFLERKGAETALVTTAGFEDVLLIGRQNRPRLYDFRVERPAPMVSRDRIFGVRERMRYDGTVQRPLGKTAGRRLRTLIRKSGAGSVAVCLLHSYANSDHERQLARSLEGLGIPVTLSSRLLPEFREYERLTTTLINAYLAPVMSSYIERLARAVAPVSLSVQQSNGGILPADGIADRAVHTVLSGPAGGVHGAYQLARRLGRTRLITLDMGGTSTDVCLCDGRPSLTRDYHLDGYPVRIPVLDIHTVGAGGGSLAWIDAGGLLRVGPESAGADPGPVCYGGGDRLTVTDANLFLGRLLPDFFLGGAMPLDAERVRTAMHGLAERLELDAEAAALGIIRIVNAGMSRAIRAVSLERGHDPENFALFGYGGASGLHCCELAAELGINTVVVPARAGILSAQGMVFAEPVLDFMQTLFLRGGELYTPVLEKAFRELVERGLAEARSLCRPAGDGELAVSRRLNLRYQGQSHELCVEYAVDFAERFHVLHEYTYGYRLDDLPLELVSIQCLVTHRQPRETLPETETRAAGEPAAERRVVVMFAEGRREIPMYYRRLLEPGHRCPGPALVADDYTTVLLPAGWRLSVDGLSNLVLER